MQAFNEHDHDDAFAVLGLSPGCTRAELKQAYRQLVRTCHPDINPNPDAGSQMRRINAAFEVATRVLDQRTNATSLLVKSGSPPPAIPVERAYAPSVSPQAVKHFRALLAVTLARHPWLSIGMRGVLVIAVGLAAAVFVLHARISGASATRPVSPRAVLQLGGTTILDVTGLGQVTLAEHGLTQLPKGLQVTDNPQWSYDGQYLAVNTARPSGGHSQAFIFIIRAQGGLIVQKLPGFFARWAPRSDQLAVLTTSSDLATPQLSIVNMTPTGDQVVMTRSAGTRLAWSLTGEKLAFSVQSQHGIRILDTTSNTLSSTYKASARTLLAPLLWLSETEILCSQVSGGISSLAVLDTGASVLVPLDNAASSTIFPARNPGDDEVLYASEVSQHGSSSLHLLHWRSRLDKALPQYGEVTFIAGWSSDTYWLAVVRAHETATAADICLLWLTTAPATSSYADPPTCVEAAGTIGGIAWEPTTTTLAYVLIGVHNDSLEVREISLGSSGTQPTIGPEANRSTFAMLVSGAGMRIIRRWLTTRRKRSKATVDLLSRPRTLVNDDTTVPEHALHVTVISEALKWPPDEALKRTALSLVKELAPHAHVTAIAARGQRPSAEPYPAIPVEASRTFIDRRLWQLLWPSRPDILCYLPGSGLTTFSLLRALILRFGFLAVGARPLLLLVSLQPRTPSLLDRWLIHALPPTQLLVQSDRTRAALAAEGCNVGVLPAGVDLDAFYPVASGHREELRKTYHIPVGRFVALHVGHLKANRNLDYLMELRRQLPGIEVVMVASTSTVAEPGLADALRLAGIHVIDRYLPHVEEVYQLADCYIFPVRAVDGCAEMPLSVLEALACGLPVITTPFGAISEWLPPSECVHYFETMAELSSAVAAQGHRFHSRENARQLALSHGWTSVIGQLVRDLWPTDIHPAANREENKDAVRVARQFARWQSSVNAAFPPSESGRREN